jgi:16S rRNA (cytidine1402-2'-O)-methyltransferase
MEKGNLYLIPSLLGEVPPGMVIPSGTLEIIRGLKVFIVEELRTARRFLKKAGFSTPFEEIMFLVLNEHTPSGSLSELLDPAHLGANIGLLSEAGMPCVADPGSELVRLAHQTGIRVVPLTGPSSILLALSASGFNGQNFSFVGYLPVDREARNKRIREIEKELYEKDQTQVFIETPYRNNQMLHSLKENCRSGTLLCIAADLTAPGEWICVRTIAEWRKTTAEPGKRPCVFLLYR